MSKWVRILVAVAALVGAAAAMLSGGGGSGDAAVAVAGDDPSTTTSTERLVGAATPELLDALAALRLEPEGDRGGYDRALFPHWDDEDGDGCDTRCEVLGAQQRVDGTWLSEWDGYSTPDASELQVDHVVALAEAWDSGAATWPPDRRDAYADWVPNLLAVSAAMNLAKGDRDAAEWFPARAEANCLWASTVVRVKARWDLAVDTAERDALANLLRTCSDAPTPPTTTTTPPTTTTTTAPPPATTAPPPTTTAPPPPTTMALVPAGGCTPGYSPCIPPGGDVDCAGGRGNGPRYVEGPVTVDPAGGDPYGLDGEGDGIGCEG
jgi:hypothetical protein